MAWRQGSRGLDGSLVKGGKRSGMACILIGAPFYRIARGSLKTSLACHLRNAGSGLGNPGSGGARRDSRW